MFDMEEDMFFVGCGDDSFLDKSSMQWRSANDFTDEQWATIMCLIEETCTGLTDQEVDENMVCWDEEKWTLYC